MPLALLMLTLPATATAFLHCVINQNHAPRDTFFTIQAANKDSDTDISRIDKLLKKKQQELLSNTSKLQEQHPQSVVAADNEAREARGALTSEQMVREALLSTRLPLPFLHRTKLGPSKLNGAGRGLFAAENIAEGEVITCYPGDALLCEMPSLEDFNENEVNEKEEEYDDNLDDEDEDEYIDEVVLWGAHVTTNDRWDDDTVFDGTESTPALTSYAVSVNDGYYSVMGHPSLDDNPAYYGHFANDGAGQLALEKANSPNNIQAAKELGLDTEEEFSVEENIALYVLKSIEVANAKHQSLVVGDLHMLTVATRDIEEGEEIYVTYGHEYWAGYES
jgi:hypothetical protein